LSERRITKLCLTNSQVRENLPIARSYDVSVIGKKTKFGRDSVWKKDWEAPIVHWLHVLLGS
jgi:hypothetical protein